MGALNAGGVYEKSRFSTSISLYLGNDTRYGNANKKPYTIK